MLRQTLLGSILGSAAMALRDRYELLTAPREALGTVANDQLAGHLVTRLASPGTSFIDVGAHIGSIIAEVRRHCPGVSIVAFEAIPEKAARLTAKFPGVAVHGCGLSDREGTAPFFIDLRRSGYSSLARSHDGVREVRVPLRTLDSFGLAGAVDVIKIDVEGAELGVLRGAADLIARSRPVIMFESGPHEQLGYGKAEMWAFFDKAGYAIHLPNRVAHTAPGLSLEGFIDSHDYPRRTTNYFAIPVERRDEIRERARRILGI